MTNEELQIKLAALSNGDKTAFEEIYKHLNKPMYTIILRITQDKALSEDILQEVFIKLYKSPPKPPIRKPRAYIFQIVRNLAIDSVRKRPQFADLKSIEDIVYLPTDDFSQKMDIDHAMKTLPLQECQIVSLRINGQLKFREIAGMMDIPLGTVLWKYQKAVGRLRSILSGGAI
ncbi:RNA polymerase sigma factor SigM [Oxobacter pfennigii]|uniref:RNA polymerase sigma factor SigM n=1 Tax=Oxobacter pfennigii TaxID=36849 RepID=A0A0P8W1T4_9CLOT|nr:sigma-70 family RNA polymerase sigma factor [Oxobacter pfennigii]KPU42461.1 RNA polymerase sigma factor SigM [Oxobacter pfennigii]